jgi:hypothetical protein
LVVPTVRTISCANTVVGSDGKVIGADPDANIRFQLQREGHFDAD